MNISKFTERQSHTKRESALDGRVVVSIAILDTKKPEMNRPTVKDFTCTPNPEDDLDGFHAWKNFGGLTVDEAFQKFCDYPENYQEDFMWMGAAAFEFYFPVIDRYIREKELENGFDGETHILAHCIGMQLTATEPCVARVFGSIVDLCDFVLHNVKFVRSDEDRGYPVSEIEFAWTNLMAKTRAQI